MHCSYSILTARLLNPAQDLHQSYGARRAQQSFSRSLTNAKSAAVREAQERRAAAAVAKAKKGSKR